jgi:hypothetical protein
VEGTIANDNDVGNLIADALGDLFAGVVNSPGKRLGQALLLLSVAYPRSAPHLPAYRQGSPPVGQRRHQHLPLAGKLESIDKYANPAARSNGLLQKKLRDWPVAVLRVYLLVGEKPPYLSGFALQGGRADPFGGHLREVHVPSLVQAGDHPAKVAALGLAQLLGEVLAKSLVHLTLHTKAVHHRYLWLVSCWFTGPYNLQLSTERWAAFSVLKRL